MDWKSLHWSLALYLVYDMQTHLRLDSVTTLFTQVHKVHDSTSQVCQSGNRLHFNRVHLLERVVQDSRSVDNLPSEVLVVHVTDEQGFGGESVGLDVDVRTSDLVDKRTLSNVGVAANQQSTGVWIDRWQTRDMLSDLLEIRQRVFLSLHDCSHTTESGLFELLTSVERVTELEQSDIVFSDLRNKVSSGVELTQSKFVVVLVVKDVQQGGEERVQILPLTLPLQCCAISSSRRGWGTRK